MNKNDRDYTNGEITVHWQPSKCVHSTICYTRLKSVFDPAKRPWVNMEGSTTDKIIEIVNQCPTDALTFSLNKELKKPIEVYDVNTEITPTSEPSTKIQIIHDGPAIISGDFIIYDHDGNKLPKADILTLCRCGNSENKPFCDGTHTKIGFKDNR